VGFTVVQIQPTPNPNAMKFVLNGSISSQPISFLKVEEATGHPLASSLFSIPGVSHVMLLGDFVTIGKQPQASWSQINEPVKQILASLK
jgi:hypothetical protein